MNNVLLVLSEMSSVMLSTIIPIALHHTVHILVPMSMGLVEECKLIFEYSHEVDTWRVWIDHHYSLIL